MNTILGAFYIRRCIFLINVGYIQDCHLVTLKMLNCLKDLNDCD